MLRSLIELKREAQFVKIPTGHDVFVDGDRVDGIALLLSGVVRVYKIGETGREITLYRFGLGESCILSANAIMSQKSFPAIATVEDDAEAVMIPADVFREWVNKYELWREFVFDLLSARLSTVMTVVDEVVFKRMDRRVASLLLKSGQGPEPDACYSSGNCCRVGKFTGGDQPHPGGFLQRRVDQCGAGHDRSIGV